MEVLNTKTDSASVDQGVTMNSSLQIQFGLNVRDKRKQLGITQDELAHLADMDRSYVGRIERGEANITLDILYKIASCLNCSPLSLLPDTSLQQIDSTQA